MGLFCSTTHIVLRKPSEHKVCSLFLTLPGGEEEEEEEEQGEEEVRNSFFLYTHG